MSGVGESPVWSAKCTMYIHFIVKLIKKKISLHGGWDERGRWFIKVNIAGMRYGPGKGKEEK